MKRVLAKLVTSRMVGPWSDLASDDGVERDAEGVPVAFRIWKAGMNRTDHGDHVFTTKSAEMILAQQAERGNLYSFDVDHMSLNDQAPPENHKAVAWCRLAVRAGELWAIDVQFNASVKGGVTPDNPEWRYFSPAYDVDTKTGEIVRYINTALTNNPATHNVTALATVATAKETAMADEEKKDEKKEETLAGMLAAYEAEPSDEKRAGMRKDILAKFAAEFPPPEDDKKDEKKESKKADMADGDSEKKETKKATETDEDKQAKVAASIADKALVDFESKRKQREEEAEKGRILASLPAGDRETYKDFTLAQLERVVKRHHADVLSVRAAAGNTMPTVRGADAGKRAGMLPVKEREELDEIMGIRATRPFVTEKGTSLEIDPLATPDDARRMLSSIAGEKKIDPKMKDSEALSRILSTQKGAA